MTKPMLTVPTHILQRKDINANGKLLLAAIEMYPNLTSGQIAVKLWSGPRTIYSLAKQLCSRGVIQRVRNGVHTYYRIP